MKILMISPYLSEVFGGLPKVVLELSKSIGKIGLEVDLVTTPAGDIHSFDLPLNDWLIKDHYRIQYFSAWCKNDFVVSPSLFQWLRQNLKNYDLIHTHSVFSPFMVLVHALCRRHGIPYISTPHGMLEPWALSHKASKKKPFYQLFDSPALQKAAMIHAIATAEVKNLQDLGFSNIRLIPNGIHAEEYAQLPNPEVFYQQFPQTRDKTLLLFLARVDPKKGLDLLAPALAQVRAQFPNVHLIVAGPDNIGFLPTAQNYFATVGCADAVTYTGLISGELKSAALAAADLYVAPSYSEGFSMSVIEGMASGLPCVITTGCNFPEADIAQAAKVVEINAEAIASALLDLLQDQQSAQDMGQRARQFILENYTWGKIAQRLVEVYQEILHSSDSLNSSGSRTKVLKQSELSPVPYT